MNERVQSLESAVEAIEAALARLEQRISALEAGRPAPAEEIAEDVAEAGGGDTVSEIDSHLAAVMGTPTLVGRSLLVLAGAFLLRAMTERGSFAPEMGVVMGLTYAAIWVAASGLAARMGLRASAVFHAVCSAVISGPLIFEAVSSFGVLSPNMAALVLAAFTAVGLTVAVRWRLQAVAWVFVVTCLMAAAAVATVRSPGEAATAVVVVLGAAVLWISGRRDWKGLKWVTALAADLAVLRLTAIATVIGDLPPMVGVIHPTVVVLLQSALVLVFVCTFVIWALRGYPSVEVFGWVQTAMVWIVGWGGAVRLAEANGWSTTPLSLLALAGGVVAYAGAFGFVDRRRGENTAFLYLSSLGLGLVLVGLPGIAGGATALVWAGLGLVTAAIGSRWDRVTMRVHASILLAASWIASGVVAEAVDDLGGPGAIDATMAAAVLVVVALTLTTTAVIVVGQKSREQSWAQRVPATCVLLMSAIAVAAVIVVALEAGLPTGAALGTGTVALSLVTVGLAVLARKWGVREAGWLVYPFLVLGGLRMVVRDFLSGQTLVLVIALAAYGIGLIVATRLVGVSLKPADGESASPE